MAEGRKGSKENRKSGRHFFWESIYLGGKGGEPVFIELTGEKPLPSWKERPKLGKELRYMGQLPCR